MTTFAAITSGQVDAESIIDTTLAGQWANNVLAMFEGDASASGVRLQTGAIEDAAITKVKITTATVSLAGSITTQAYVDIAMTAYCFFPMISTDSVSSEMPLQAHKTDGASPDAPRFRLHNTDGADTRDYDVDYRYIDA